MPDANGPPQIFCPTCGRALGDEVKIARRESDWHGVRLRLSEKVLVAAVVGVANAVAVGITILTR